MPAMNDFRWWMRLNWITQSRSNKIPNFHWFYGGSTEEKLILRKKLTLNIVHGHKGDIKCETSTPNSLRNIARKMFWVSRLYSMACVSDNLLRTLANLVKKSMWIGIQRQRTFGHAFVETQTQPGWLNIRMHCIFLFIFPFSGSKRIPINVQLNRFTIQLDLKCICNDYEFRKV